MEISTKGVTKAEFEQVFKAHFKALHAYACTILREETQAEEIVQQVFFKLWEKREQLDIKQSIQAYLYRSVYNHCLNHIKHLKVRKAHQAHAIYTGSEVEVSASKKVIGKELQVKIADAMEQLPEQCRTIFQMSRFEELKYREIADKLKLSVKTIENQMGKALKIMRIHLSEYLTALIGIVIWVFT